MKPKHIHEILMLLYLILSNQTFTLYGITSIPGWIFGIMGMFNAAMMLFMQFKEKE